MEDIFVGRLMSTSIRTVRRDSSVQAAAETMLEHDTGSVVIVDDANQIEGILTTTDLVRIGADGRSTADTAVEAYMSTNVVTTSVNESICEAADKLNTYRVHHLPVVDETDGVIGMLSTADLTAYLSGIRVPASC